MTAANGFKQRIRKTEDKKMELKGSKTEQNLMAAFAGESQARNKYTYYAQKAREEGMEQILNVCVNGTDLSGAWKTVVQGIKR